MRSFPLVGGRGSGQVGKGFFLFALGPGLLLSVLVWGSFLLIMVNDNLITIIKYDIDDGRKAVTPEAHLWPLASVTDNDEG